MAATRGSVQARLWTQGPQRIRGAALTSCPLNGCCEHLREIDARWIASNNALQNEQPEGRHHPSWRQPTSSRVKLRGRAPQTGRHERDEIQVYVQARQESAEVLEGVEGDPIGLQ